MSFSSYFLVDFNYPATRRFDTSHLDTREGVVELLRDGAHFGHTCGEADFASVVNNLTNWRDNGCRATESTLGKAVELVLGDNSLLSRIVFFPLSLAARFL